METEVLEAIHDLSPEAARVMNWRYNWLKSAGYSEVNALTLARQFDIDYSFANALLKNCKDEERAMEILL